jgi:hypothetical protein
VSTDPFDTALFFCLADHEEAGFFTRPVDAIAHALDLIPEVGATENERYIREHGPFTLHGYVRTKVANPEHVVRRAVSDALERFIDDFQSDEEYGDPEGNHDCFSLELIERVRPKLEAAFAELVAGAEPWSCDKAGQRTFTVDEALAMLREHRSELFGEVPSG